jgi:uncharacterized Zn finger protein (UPF0148 family)
VIVEAMCTYEALLSSPSKISTGCVMFERNKKYSLDFSDPEQRKLTTLSWKLGTQAKWVFEFDRANSSDPMNRIWFCNQCGMPFFVFSEMGNHVNAEHGNKTKREVAEAQKLEAELVEEAAVNEQQRLAQVEEEKRRIAEAQERLRKLQATVPAEKPEELIVTERRGKGFGCKVCGEKFPSPHALQVHKKEAHAVAVEPVPQEVTAGA